MKEQIKVILLLLVLLLLTTFGMLFLTQAVQCKTVWEVIRYATGATSFFIGACIVTGCIQEYMGDDSGKDDK